MRITIGGLPGSGKSTVAKILAKKLKLKHYSVGDFRRKLAKKLGMTIEQLNKLGEKDISTDLEADMWQRKLAKRDNFVIDGRLSFYFIPNSIKIYLKVDPREAAERVFKNPRETEKRYKSIKEVMKAQKERIKSDIKRYKQYYGINCYNEKKFDLVIDTTKLTPEQVVGRIVAFIKKKQKGKKK